jgi:Pectate lyase superfamily protein
MPRDRAAQLSALATFVTKGKKTMATQLSAANVESAVRNGAGPRVIAPAKSAQRHRRGKAAAAARFFAIVSIGLTCIALASPSANAQGSRRDDVVFGPSGHPVAGATITVCQATATGTPCSPLATLYTDATLTTVAPNPFQGDGIGNYHFYAPAGRYLVQITGPQITGTINYPDVILPADVSSSGAGNNISAFGLTLGGNLNVAGNATVSGTLTTSNFNPGAFTPSTLSVLGNETVAGPRPRTDVTGFGAKGDGVTDDTAAIQAAITATCNAAGSPSGGGTIFFPPGSYIVSQPQLPSTAAIFPLPCGSLHFIGGNNLQSVGGAAGNRAPQTRIIAVQGANPNAAPVFLVKFPNGAGSDTFENLTINGYNQAMWFYTTNENSLKNTCLTVRLTGMADNTPLKLTNTFWFFMDGGCLQSGAAGFTQPIGIFTGETPLSIESALVGLAFFTNIEGTGGGFQYIQRVNTSGSGPGNFAFRNVAAIEDPGTSFFTITNATGNPGSAALPIFSSMTFENVTSSDAVTSGNAIIELNSPGTVLSGVTVKDSFAGNSGQGPAIRIDAGTLNGCNVVSGGGQQSSWVVDSNGSPIGNCSTENAMGFDYIVNTTIADRTRSDLFPTSDLNGPAFRTSASGNRFASMGIDPTSGVMFNTGSDFGFGASVAENSKATLDVQFAGLYPPTAVTGAATTGGALAAATYYPIVLTTSDNCTHLSARSIQGAGVVVGGSNNAVTVTWTLPTAGTAAIAGYCVNISTTPDMVGTAYWNPQRFGFLFVSGASTASATLNSVPTGGTLPVTNTLGPVHRFTPTSLGINTTNPLFNLDVNGTAAVNALNSVQKAERFTGADAGVQINACLTAAVATSSICDARGLMGTLTATHHISIPAGTTLLWGHAQLVISDSTTNDAIELTGDGASIKGYQESGLGTVAAPDTSGYIGCGIAGCTVVKKPNPTASKINFVHIEGMYLQANGANSKVIDMTSIGHSDIENNNLQLGTGGNSFGVYGSSSVGGFDASNTLFKHNNFQPETAGDTCFSLTGTYNAVVLEQNTCVLPPGASTGYVFAKDSSGNYPNNDEVYGNDCETASQAFNQICYNIVGATSITFGPNNRCENVYNCYQFPSDGSAVGIHVLDPYLSITNNTQIKPNEPATAMVALDNNGHNWTPSMHYGMNDLAGDNLLGNASFEGWQNTTSLYYWGGVTAAGVINQPGSGIYLQNASSSATPAVDAYTQGTSNVRVGDGATAGLGINSGCIPVDATKEYTLMLRVASGATTNTFRPGIRFYYDANCTTADVISTVATNARVLSPANYAGTSSTTANYQSTNASLTYNNGITCGCNVTGADWQVSTAGAWTPTRNFGLIFRAPNGYSLSTTVAHSMRIFLLENTAAAGNYVYFDDVILSQGPVTPDVRLAALRDSQNPTVYGSLGISQHLNQGAANTFAGSVALAAGTATVTFPTAFNSAPVCTANDSSAIATVRVQTTATTLTLSQASGTDTILYICVGNPN